MHACMHRSYAVGGEGCRALAPLARLPALLRSPCSISCCTCCAPCTCRAQYAMEAALAATAFGTLCASGGGLAGGAEALVSSSKLLAGAGATLLLDAAVVFPALDVRGRRLIAESTAAPGATSSLSPQQMAYTAALRRGVEGKASPPAQLHLASVLLAFARAGLLGGVVWQQLMVLSSSAAM